jgi:hypothetical protein
MAKIVIVSSAKTKIKIQLSPKLTKNLIRYIIQEVIIPVGVTYKERLLSYVLEKAV